MEHVSMVWDGYERDGRGGMVYAHAIGVATTLRGGWGESVLKKHSPL